jgi:hypothetical protein
VSQYPTPYQPPNYYNQGYYYADDPYGEYLRPARRASVLMFVLAALAVLLGTCALAGLVVYSNPQLMQQYRDQFPNRPVPTSGEMLFAGVFFWISAVVLVVLGVWVRRGGRAAAITALVPVSLVTVFLLLGTLWVLARGLPADACMNAVVVVPLGVLIIWLAQAIGAAGQLKLAMDQYAAQYWQYMQQQQQYAQPPAVPPSAQMPPPPPPVQPPPPDNTHQ